MSEKLVWMSERSISLIIMNTFMGQDNMNIESLCLKNNSELVIVLHNLTKKFQPFGATINKKARKFFSSRINRWCTEKASRQLTNDKSPDHVLN